MENSGCFIAALTNERGDPVGPLRVWKDENGPGLAMTRSLGDTLGHSVGINATAVCYDFPRDIATDRFIVIGSDGIWDTMSNEQVSKFLEKRRHATRRQTTDRGYSMHGKKVLPSECTISELLV